MNLAIQSKNLRGGALMKSDVNYLAAKLEEIHADVRQLQGHVDDLRQEAAGRKATHRFIFSALGIIGATMGWIMNALLKVGGN